MIYHIFPPDEPQKILGLFKTGSKQFNNDDSSDKLYN